METPDRRYVRKMRSSILPAPKKYRAENSRDVTDDRKDNGEISLSVSPLFCEWAGLLPTRDMKEGENGQRAESI